MRDRRQTSSLSGDVEINYVRSEILAAALNFRFFYTVFPLHNAGI
jgi:hypothetical protein